eukprot:4926000-Amphidinium_carterae.1
MAGMAYRPGLGWNMHPNYNDRGLMGDAVQSLPQVLTQISSDYTILVPVDLRETIGILRISLFEGSGQEDFRHRQNRQRECCASPEA